MGMVEVWEDELFDRYNGEGQETEEEFWAAVWEEV